MASELLNKYGNAISSFTLIPAGGGVFEVTKNENLLFSKMNKAVSYTHLTLPTIYSV